MVVGVVAVGGLAGSVSGSHVYSPDMFAGSAAIWGHSPGPAFTIAGAGSVGVLQGFVFDVGIGVGRERPNSRDLLVHENGGVEGDEIGSMFLL